MHRVLIFAAAFVLLCAGSVGATNETNEPLAIRGYYTTFMRMPTFGLSEWKQMIDCMREDGANTLILWTAGAFRSKKFPITWRYNADHKNVENDFVRELIAYAHTRQIKVLLGFTPFAYDGVNQYPLERTELKATQKSGQPANFWGMHSWGYNLCPSRPESQRFMLEYIREMFFEFYPDADGLMIESSDYAICYCAECGEKFFDKEFVFVRQISEELWRAKTNAAVVVYPHYFSTRKVPGFDVAGSTRRFDQRWTLFFTPHSAHVETNLAARARSSIYWNEGLTVGTPARMRDGARFARRHNLGGYIASCEPFSCVDGPPGSNKPRQKPFHFDWLRDGEMPLNELPARVNRIAYREYSQNPELRDQDFRRVLGERIFGQEAREENVVDLLFVQDCWFSGADWFAPAPLLAPEKLQRRAAAENWPAAKLQDYTARVDRLREVARRYSQSRIPAERELARVASVITGKWDSVELQH